MSDKENFQSKNAIRALLKRAGFDQKEIEVYLALLSLKVAPAGTVAKVSGQQRSNTYLLLQSLEKRGLVSRIRKGSVIHFVAEHPRKLLVTLEKQEQALHEVIELVQGSLPYLESLEHKPMLQPRVTTYQGHEQMRDLYREIFSHEIIGIFNPAQMYRVFKQGTLNALGMSSLQLKGREIVVWNESSKRFMEGNEATEKYEYRFLPPTVKIDVDIVVFQDAVMLFTFDEDLTVVRIDNKPLATALRTGFDLLWSICKKPEDMKDEK